MKTAAKDSETNNIDEFCNQLAEIFYEQRIITEEDEKETYEPKKDT